MIKTANTCKKCSRIGKRRARIAFWRAESKNLRKKHRALLNGASLLTVIILTAHVLLCAEVFKILKILGASEIILRLFVASALVFGFVILSLLNIGGRHLALSLYRKERTPNSDKITVGELFYSFGSKKRRSKSAHLLYSDLKKYLLWITALLIPILFYVSLGSNTITIAVSVICALFIIFPSQSTSLEWIFELKRRFGEGSVNCKAMSRYATNGREKELRKIKSKVRACFVLSCLLPIFGLILYFPYSWSNNAVCAECVYSELVSPRQ